MKQKLFSYILTITFLVTVSELSAKVWTIKISCSECGKIIDRDNGNKRTSICKGKGDLECPFIVRPFSMGNGITVDFTNAIESAGLIEKKLLKQVEDMINSGRKTGLIIHNPDALTNRETSQIRLHANRMLNIADNELEVPDNLIGKYKFATWRVNSDGSVSIALEV
jgi:hypothetical protein